MSETTTELRKDIAASVVWSFQALLAAAAFCAISSASHPDWELLTGTLTSAPSSALATAAATDGIEVPIVKLKVGLLAFFIVAPSVLIAMQIYLQVQTRALLRLAGGSAANGLIQNHVRLWPLSLLGFASFLVVPVTLASLLWKIWPRRAIDDTFVLPFTHMMFSRVTLTVCMFFLTSCLISVWAAAAEWRSLRSSIEEDVRPAIGNVIAAAGTAGLFGFLLFTLVGLLSDRRLELRKAPLDGADLRHFDLRHADLREARLHGAILGGAMLANASLASAVLDYADLRGAELSGADLWNARLNGADLTGACLVGAKLSGVEIEGTRFNYTWLVGALLVPKPRSRLDRAKPPEDSDIDYEKQGVIAAADFSDAKMCGSLIGVGHWSASASLGTPDVKAGPAFHEAAGEEEHRTVPTTFRTTLYDKIHDGETGGRNAFFSNVMKTCFDHLQEEKITGQCPEARPESHMAADEIKQNASR